MPEVVIDRSAGAGDRVALPKLSCALRTDGLGANWVQAQGELDLIGARQLRRRLEELHGAGALVVLDLREQSVIDRSGVHLIADLASLAGQYGSPRQLPAGAAT